MKRWMVGVIAGGAAVVLAGGATAFAMNADTPMPEPTVTTVVQVADVAPKPTVKPTPTPVEVAVPIVPVVEEVAPPPPALELCPAGTVAQHVDEAGNESNCLETNDQGQQCVKYGENDQCVAWLEG